MNPHILWSILLDRLLLFSYIVTHPKASSYQEEELKVFVPTKLFLTRGVGEHREELQSFELALRKAEIAVLNLAKI